VAQATSSASTREARQSFFISGTARRLKSSILLARVALCGKRTLLI
jgi:hypothetical protein